MHVSGCNGAAALTLMEWSRGELMCGSGESRLVGTLASEPGLRQRRHRRLEPTLLSWTYTLFMAPIKLRGQGASWGCLLITAGMFCDLAETCFDKKLFISCLMHLKTDDKEKRNRKENIYCAWDCLGVGIWVSSCQLFVFKNLPPPNSPEWSFEDLWRSIGSTPKDLPPPCG